MQLVNPGAGTEDTRRLATRGELERDWDLTAKLASERLIVTNQASEDTERVETVEVVHEVLIRNWGTILVPRNMFQTEWEEFFPDEDYRKTCPNVTYP